MLGEKGSKDEQQWGIEFPMVKFLKAVESEHNVGAFEEDVTRNRLLATAHKTTRFMLMACVFADIVTKPLGCERKKPSNVRNKKKQQEQGIHGEQRGDAMRLKGYLGTKVMGGGLNGNFAHVA